MRVRMGVLIGIVFVLACAYAVTGLMAPSASAVPQGQFCGGFAGIPCPEGFTCVDVPGDGCNPKTGGADCAGYCKKSK